VNSSLPTTRPFLITEGGPLFLIETRFGTVKRNSLAQIRRAAFSVLLTWLPLLVLSALQGTAFGSAVTVPFLQDFGAHTRFLVTVPVLLAAETIMAPYIAEAASHFVNSGLVLEPQFDLFAAAIERGLKSRDSVAAEIWIALLAYAMTFLFFIPNAVHAATWYADRSADGFRLTLAGWWFLGFCIPLGHFLVLRWLWRFSLWCRFLSDMNKLDLQLYPTHPDQAGGLGFIGKVQRFFGILLAAYSATIAGVWANEIFYDHIPLEHFAMPAAAYVIAGVVLVLAPLLVFSKRLFLTKRNGLYEYGTLATTYTGSFDRKWISRTEERDDALLGSADIQSLADLGNSYTFIENMNVFPVTPKTPLILALACLLPMSPLLLTVISLKDMFKLLYKALV
jgi:hypothetical protein